MLLLSTIMYLWWSCNDLLNYESMTFFFITISALFSVPHSRQPCTPSSLFIYFCFRELVQFGSHEACIDVIPWWHLKWAVSNPSRHVIWDCQTGVNTLPQWQTAVNHLLLINKLPSALHSTAYSLTCVMYEV